MRFLISCINNQTPNNTPINIRTCEFDCLTCKHWTQVKLCFFSHTNNRRYKISTLHTNKTVFKFLHPSSSQIQSLPIFTFPVTHFTFPATQLKHATSPGSGEALLRGQVKTLLQKVEEEAVISKISFESRISIRSQEKGSGFFKNTI